MFINLVVTSDIHTLQCEAFFSLVQIFVSETVSNTTY